MVSTPMMERPGSALSTRHSDTRRWALPHSCPVALHRGAARTIALPTPLWPVGRLPTFSPFPPVGPLSSAPAAFSCSLIAEATAHGLRHAAASTSYTLSAAFSHNAA